MPLHIVKPIPAPTRKRKPSANPVGFLQCQRCNGREVISTTIGATFSGGKLRGGTVQVLCACCLMRGERVVLA